MTTKKQSEHQSFIPQSPRLVDQVHPPNFGIPHQQAATVTVAACSRSVCYSEIHGLPGEDPCHETGMRQDYTAPKVFHGAIKSRFHGFDSPTLGKGRSCFQQARLG